HQRRAQNGFQLCSEEALAVVGGYAHGDQGRPRRTCLRRKYSGWSASMKISFQRLVRPQRKSTACFWLKVCNPAETPDTSMMAMGMSMVLHSTDAEASRVVKKR